MYMLFQGISLLEAEQSSNNYDDDHSGHSKMNDSLVGGYTVAIVLTACFLIGLSAYYCLCYRVDDFFEQLELDDQPDEEENSAIMPVRAIWSVLAERCHTVQRIFVSDIDESIQTPLIEGEAVITIPVDDGSLRVNSGTSV
tara:strand:+ start:556 stop:978 length:423 start_codon:yes stop_codon:yes gene_type:complete